MKLAPLHFAIWERRYVLMASEPKGKPEELLQQAEAEMCRPNKQLDILLQARALAPNHPTVLSELARLLTLYKTRAQKNADRDKIAALFACNQALRINPNDQAILALKAGLERRTPKPIFPLPPVRQPAADSAELTEKRRLFLSCQTIFQKGNYAQAVKELEPLAAAHPDNIGALCFLELARLLAEFPFAAAAFTPHSLGKGKDQKLIIHTAKRLLHRLRVIEFFLREINRALTGQNLYRFHVSIFIACYAKKEQVFQGKAEALLATGVPHNPVVLAKIKAEIVREITGLADVKKTAADRSEADIDSALDEIARLICLGKAITPTALAANRHPNVAALGAHYSQPEHAAEFDDLLNRAKARQAEWQQEVLIFLHDQRDVPADKLPKRIFLLVYRYHVFGSAEMKEIRALATAQLSPQKSPEILCNRHR